jgi:NAD dependent epimerase/dehydratase family enzyme
MSWIHIDDIVGILQLAVENEAAAGPVNGTAPNPVRNAEFSRVLSSVLRKPYTPWRFFIPFGPPDAMLKLMLGEVAGVITGGQKVLPMRTSALGYYYKFPDLAEALRDLFTRQPTAKTQAKPVPAAAGSHH